jgi:hypothetical protein
MPETIREEELNAKRGNTEFWQISSFSSLPTPMFPGDDFGFSPGGRLLQHEYAGRAVSQGPLVLGATGKSCYILMGAKQTSVIVV